ncbi:hypothetical protein [Xanthomonas graminis]|uniref:hypothetical protein n=1 Tax=Xanthomonas graminis TaxID=3390026 RepID=UPI000B30D727|nr:hypothetical protein [Xanthomonas translucens]UKE65392.1 hypothetical protein KM547_17240 [Xanthomonas translucens pv. phlei]
MLTERALDIADTVKQVAADIGHSPAQVALTWLLQRPGGGAIPIVDARPGAAGRQPGRAGTATGRGAAAAAGRGQRGGASVPARVHAPADAATAGLRRHPAAAAYAGDLNRAADA